MMRTKIDLVFLDHGNISGFGVLRAEHEGAHGGEAVLAGLKVERLEGYEPAP